MEEKKINQCEICPLLNVVHKSGETTQIKYCVMYSALKQAKERYDVCGQELDIKFGDAPTPEQVVEEKLKDADVIDSGFLDHIEKQAQEL